MVRALAALERGQVAEQPQSEAGVTYAKKITKEEARIDWNKSARRNGLPDPRLVACARRLQRSERRAAENPLCRTGAGPGAPGEIIDDGLTVACGDGALRLDQACSAPAARRWRRTNCSRVLRLPPGTRFS